MTATSDPRIRWGAPIVLVAIVLIGYLWLRPKTHAIGTAYVSDKSVPLWTSTAEVKQQVVVLHYGDRVTILAQQGPVDQVRSDAGATGWMDSDSLMDPALWQKSTALLARAQVMEVQARGYAKTVTNVRIEPGRSADRIYQFTRNVPVVILARAAAPAPQADAGADQSNSGEQDNDKPKLEDWLLVMRDTSAATESSPAESAGVSAVASGAEPSPAAGDSSGAGATAAAEAAPPMAGWVLARFIELNPPGPVRDIAQSSDLHVVAWFALNSVMTDSGAMPQYLVAGSRGEEGQPCDFTLLRVYTWDDPQQRYETAFLESDLCGKLPIHVFENAGDPEFKFAEADGAGSERIYAMHRTMVRRVDANQKIARAPRHSAK